MAEQQWCPKPDCRGLMMACFCNKKRCVLCGDDKHGIGKCVPAEDDGKRKKKR